MAAVEEGTDTVLMVWERNSAGTDNWEEVSLQFTGLQHGYGKINDPKGALSNRTNNELCCSGITITINIVLLLENKSQNRP